MRRDNPVVHDLNRRAALILAILPVVSCSQRDVGEVRSKSGSEVPAPVGREVAWLGDLHQPESARYDAEQDVFFISNMVGFGSDKDANGYIVMVKANDLSSSRVFAESGKAGVVLDAPKGMAIHGDTLWICDIDIMRAIDRHTGAPLGSIDFRPQGAIQLNDVIFGGDGAMYVTDTGILMTPKGVIYKGGDRVFAVRDGKVSVYASGAALGRPNGITWDKESKQLVVVSFDPFHSEVYSLAPDGERKLIGTGNGKFDGVEPIGNGHYLVASWNDSSVRVLGNGLNERVANNVQQPADIGFDTKRNRLAIPVGPLNQLQLWQLPSSGLAANTQR
jgi:sugar lactone lactonase YvrE